MTELHAEGCGNTVQTPRLPLNSNVGTRKLVSRRQTRQKKESRKVHLRVGWVGGLVGFGQNDGVFGSLGPSSLMT